MEKQKNNCRVHGGSGTAEGGVGEPVERLGNELSAIALGRWTPCRSNPCRWNSRRLAKFVEVDLSELRPRRAPPPPTSSFAARTTCALDGDLTFFSFIAAKISLVVPVSSWVRHHGFVAEMFVGLSEQFQRRQRTLIPRGSRSSRL